MDAVTACWIGAALLSLLAAIAGCAWVVRCHRRQPHSFDGYGFAAFFLLGVGALAALAVGLARAGGAWATVGLVAVNALIQPLCLYLFLAGAYKAVMALTGRLVYAWRVVPPEEIPAAAHRFWRRYFLFQGALACLFASWLGWVCLSLLL